MARWGRRIQRLIDKHGNQCMYCERHITMCNYTVEHVISKSLGGSDHIDNMVPAHKECNQKIGNIIWEKKVAMSTKPDWRPTTNCYIPAMRDLHLENARLRASLADAKAQVKNDVLALLKYKYPREELSIVKAMAIGIERKRLRAAIEAL